MSDREFIYTPLASRPVVPGPEWQEWECWICRMGYMANPGMAICPHCSAHQTHNRVKISWAEDEIMWKK